MRNWAILLVIFATAGCAPTAGNYLPMAVGDTWSYQSRTGLNSSVVDLRVARKLPVGSGPGFELVCQAGASRLAWRGDTLVASQLAGTFYSPPVPVFVPAGKTPVAWEGTVTQMGKSTQAKGAASVADSEAKAGSKTVPAKQVTLTIESGGTQTEVTTWFVNGLGIVRQEQRINGLLVNRLTYLSGPGG